MATFAAGVVVLVRFPFSDLSSTKLRPAVVLADAGRGDLVLCQITSNPYADPAAIVLADSNFEVGGLQRVSYVRPGKLFTANEDLVVRQIGKLQKKARASIIEAVVNLLRTGL